MTIFVFTDDIANQKNKIKIYIFFRRVNQKPTMLAKQLVNKQKNVRKLNNFRKKNANQNYNGKLYNKKKLSENK